MRYNTRILIYNNLFINTNLKAVISTALNSFSGVSYVLSVINNYYINSRTNATSFVLIKNGLIKKY